MSSRLRATAATALALLLASHAGRAHADEYDDLEGFESEEEFEVEVDSATDEPRWWDLDGSLSLANGINYIPHDSATGTDFTGLSQMRLRLNLQLDVDLPWEWDMRLSPFIWYDFSYLINGRDDFTSQVLNDYEWQGDFQDSYLEGPILEDVDLKIGRQVVKVFDPSFRPFDREPFDAIFIAEAKMQACLV